MMKLVSLCVLLLFSAIRLFAGMTITGADSSRAVSASVPIPLFGVTSTSGETVTAVGNYGGHMGGNKYTIADSFRITRVYEYSASNRATGLPRRIALYDDEYSLVLLSDVCQAPMVSGEWVEFTFSGDNLKTLPAGDYYMMHVLGTGVTLWPRAVNLDGSTAYYSQSSIDMNSPPETASFTVGTRKMMMFAYGYKY